MDSPKRKWSTDPITAEAIHPAWPSVNSIKGVFNKKRESDAGLGSGLAVRWTSTHGSSATAAQQNSIDSGEPSSSSIAKPTPVVSVPEPHIPSVIEENKEIKVEQTNRRDSIKYSASAEIPTSADANVKKLAAKFDVRKGSIGGSKGNAKTEIAAPVEIIAIESKSKLNEKRASFSLPKETAVTSTDKVISNKVQDSPIPKNRSLRNDKTNPVEGNEITEAALKVASAFGIRLRNQSGDSVSLKAKPNELQTPAAPKPIPKTRNKAVEAVNKITASDSEFKNDEWNVQENPTTIQAPPRQSRTKENRLGVHSKDKQPETATNIVKPIASVQPTETTALRDKKIATIVEKWPPVAPVEPLQKDLCINAEEDFNNNNVKTNDYILSENNNKNARNSTPDKLDKFVTILVIGLSGSGKSIMIDELLDQKLPKFDKSEISEHTLEIKMPDSDTSFYNLRVIDTPGFKGDKFGNNFPRMFSTLLQYCRSQDGLRGKVPHLVLCVISFEESFLENDNCDFINFLKIINNFEIYFKNQKFPNFIFVLTHLGHADRHHQVYPQVRIDEFMQAIKKYTNLGSPISIVCAENHGEGAGFQVEDGFYKLPNGEMYPSNLIQEMKYILTRKTHTSLSENVIRAAFGSEYPNSIQHVKSRKIPQIKQDSPSISQMKKTLKEVFSQIKLETTEISQLLQVGWENIHPALQKTFSSSLFATQRAFQLSKILKFNDIPTETAQIFKLLRELPQNIAVADLLIHTLELKIPVNTTQASFIGQGYDLSQDRGTGLSPIQFSGILKTSPIGQIPNELQCHVTEDRAIVFKLFQSSEDYVVDRMKEMGIRHASFPGNPPMPTLKRPGYNIIKADQEPTKSTIATALLEYRSFRLTLQESESVCEFKSVFWDALTSQPQLDSKIPETLQGWKEFFNCWGTHLVKSAFGGGSVEITFKGKMLAKVFSSLNQADTIPSDEDMTNRVFQWITGDGLGFDLSFQNRGEWMNKLDVQTRLHGGEDKFQDLDLTKLPYEQVAEMRNEWKENLFVKPVMLETNLVLVPISYFVRQKCEVTALKMDMAFHYIYSQFLPQADSKGSNCAIL